MLSRTILLAVPAIMAAALPGCPATASDDGPAGALARIAPVRDRDFYRNGRFPQAQVRLGKLLFFDKVLSGNRNISCASCHHPDLGSGDAVALPLGEGAVGLGRDRTTVAAAPVTERVPRNAQPLYFLGAREYVTLFHDGRVADGHRFWRSRFTSPAREQLPEGLDNVLAVQAMFPVTSAAEMAGSRPENEIAEAAAKQDFDGPDGVWNMLAERLRRTPEYVDLFKAAYPQIGGPDDITFVHAANAIAAFETEAFRPDGSPFDRFLESRNAEALNPDARRGMALFYGKAGCMKCHSGKFQTDHKFHAIAMPQTGPGKNDGWDMSYWQETGFAGRLQDFGRFRVTLKPDDMFRFRTPGLRNVELTGPWGHSGAYDTLEGVVRHHLDPIAALKGYDVAKAGLSPLRHLAEVTMSGSQLQLSPLNPARVQDFARRDTWVQSSKPLREAIAAANELQPVALGDREVGDLVAFLKSLTDPTSRDQSDLVPARVPSGLPVAD